MIVLIDIGNTRTKYCIVNEGKRSQQQAVLNNELSQKFLSKNFLDVRKIIVASVTHDNLTEEISTWCGLNQIVYQQVISEEKKKQVTSGYQVASQLGVDRWLTLVGAAEIYPNRNILIIDAGTATTIDLLAATGQHHGGWILAGVGTLISSVLADTSQVKANSIEKESLAFGLNTSENVYNAAWAATVGAIDLAISQVNKQGIDLDEVLITGGNSKLLSSLLTCKHRVSEELVFDGLEVYIEF